MEKSNELAKDLNEDYSIINPCSIINSVFFLSPMSNDS